MKLIKAEDYGIESTKAREIEAMFTPLLKEVSKLEENYNRIINADPSDIQIQNLARDLRLEYKRKRIEVEKVHKDLKAFYLAGGRFVDGWKNSFLMAVSDNEKQLKQIENYDDIQKKKRIEALQYDRAETISEYTDVIPPNLGELESDQFNIYLNGLKAIQKQDIELERLDNLRRERLNQLHQLDIILDVTDLAELSEKEFNRLIKEAQTKRVLKLRFLQIKPYADFIDNFKDLDLAKMTKKHYTFLLNTAKSAYKEQQIRIAEISKYLHLGYQVDSVKKMTSKQFEDLIKKAQLLDIRFKKRIQVMSKYFYLGYEAKDLIELSDNEFVDLLGIVKEKDAEVKRKQLAEAKEKQQNELKARRKLLNETDNWNTMIKEMLNVVDGYEYDKLKHRSLSLRKLINNQRRK